MGPTVTLPRMDRGNAHWIPPTRQYFEQAAVLSGLPADLTLYLQHPESIYSFSLPVRMDSGELQLFRGYRVHHNKALGPFKGGVRFVPGLTGEELSALAMLMSWKFAVAGLPFGGAAGGINVDPQGLSRGELERLTRRYAASLVQVIGPHSDIPEPDINTGSDEMAWIMDTYSMNRGYSVPGVVTGKPIEIGGTFGRREAPARGAITVLKAYLDDAGLELMECRVAIQGFGAVGSVTARILSEMGVRVVAVSDIQGGVYNEMGLDIGRLSEHHAEHGTVAGFVQGAAIGSDELLTLPADILIPAAASHRLTAELAPHVQASVIVEAAHAPITAAADKILEENGIVVIPDILASSGGVVLSYFEWVQGVSQFLWSEDEINRQLDNHLNRCYRQVAETARSRNISLRMGAYCVGLSRVASAVAQRGIYP